MKKVFEEVEIRLVRFAAQDVLTTSSTGDGGSGGGNSVGGNEYDFG